MPVKKKAKKVVKKATRTVRKPAAKKTKGKRKVA